MDKIGKLEKIGKYEIVRELGKGATSVVYLARDPFADREVAIKLVRAEAFAHHELGKRFHKLFVTEASLAGKLSHPHIAAIYDAATEAVHWSVYRRMHREVATSLDLIAPQRIWMIDPAFMP